MSLTNAYLMTTKNINEFFNAILSARAPERFTNSLLSQLGFTSSNDRLYIAVMKGLGFLDEASAPTQRYYDFLDQSQSGIIMAEAIKEAYEDLFMINNNAYNMSIEEVKNKLKTLTQGQKTEKVIHLMANTFKALCDYADWSKLPEKREGEKIDSKKKDLGEEKIIGTKEIVKNKVEKDSSCLRELHYNIQIHLPETRDPAVYDAIFRSLKEHLL
ncbi:DUF5343 domain-containing protein [Candidatus Contubernalis alkalaceticus]|nr:DUF5343 domain-containing protein [Candidatus Contubernalis alkalaceticus]